MLIDYLPILLFIGLCHWLCGYQPRLSHLLGPKKPTPSKLSVYESGVQPVGNARQRFTIRFDLIAMLFIIFDIEVVFLYPWAIVFKKFSESSGYFILIEMLVFIGILFLGYIYAGRKVV